jgi:hypothetical protein
MVLLCICVNQGTQSRANKPPQKTGNIFQETVLLYKERTNRSSLSGRERKQGLGTIGEALDRKPIKREKTGLDRDKPDYSEINTKTIFMPSHVVSDHLNLSQIKNIFYFFQRPRTQEATDTLSSIIVVTARMRPASEGMRALVTTVRARSQAAHDTVLLLPNDPNVEAWFDRDRPALSCAIIFTDQYWDRYVEKDFAELEAHPPKVIVIGPRDFWRRFSRIWNVNRGAERLTDLVLNKLVPEHYDLVSQQPISFENGKDFMDVYALRGSR